jgi:hypothetical protein
MGSTKSSSSRHIEEMRKELMACNIISLTVISIDVIVP